jgi:hypothetical protein
MTRETGRLLSLACSPLGSASSDAWGAPRDMQRRALFNAGRQRAGAVCGRPVRRQLPPEPGIDTKESIAACFEGHIARVVSRTAGPKSCGFNHLNTCLPGLN